MNIKNDNKGKIVSKRDIKEVMEAHVDELMSHSGVVGVYIGALDDGTSCIKVMVIKKTSELESNIPNTLEGYQVVIEETEEIRAFPKKHLKKE